MSGRYLNNGDVEEIGEGDTVNLPDFGPCEILARVAPSLWSVRLPSGQCVKVGDRALRDMLTKSPAERLAAMEQGRD